MAESSAPIPAWWAKGLLFENCNCQVVCPGHVHFSNKCTHERCIGYWAIRFDEGSYGDVDLAGVTAVIGYDCPQHMISGGWTETVIIDVRASQAQRTSVETILTGRAGGPWELLDRFVERRLPTRTLAIEITDEDAVKRVVIEGILESTIENIRGWDRNQPVTFKKYVQPGSRFHSGDRTGRHHVRRRRNRFAERRHTCPPQPLRLVRDAGVTSLP